MKIYISGKITGADKADVKRRFGEAHELIETLGMTPVNPLENGLESDADWCQHMIRDIKLLMSCDGILMLRGWTTSKGARIEHNIASEMGKTILLENIMENDKMQREIIEIQRAIYQVTGLRIEQYSTKSRRRNLFNARAIFVRESFRKKVPMYDVSKLINRDRSTIIYTNSKYHDNVKVDPDFRVIAERVEKILAEKSQTTNLK